MIAFTRDVDQPRTESFQLKLIPDELRGHCAWVLWKWGESKPNGKRGKVPYYVNGRSRRGRQGRPQDRQQLQTAEAAVRAWLKRPSEYAGVGYCPLEGAGVVCGDFDDCVDLETGAISPLVARWVSGTYAELSPSGTGVRSFWTGEAVNAKNHEAGVELFATTGFVTFTGEPLPSSVRTLAPFSGEIRNELLDAVKGDRKTKHDGPAHDALSPTGGRSSPFRIVNDAAMANLTSWVPELFPTARPYHGGFRVTSADLGRPNEEDLSIVPRGIVDFGVHDLDDPQEGRRTPIDLVIEHTDCGGARSAALWLCERIGLNFDALPDGAAPAFSEIALADGFVEEQGALWRYCAEWGCWLRWNGYQWSVDRITAAYDAIRRFCANVSRAQRQDPDSDATGAGLARAATVSAVEKLAKAHHAVATCSDDWDAYPMHLNTPDGIVDLRTGELCQPDPSKLLSKATAVGPAEDIDCPRWLAFLEDATQGDQDVVRYLQVLSGYALTGDTSEHLLIFVHGPGGNGKSVFINVLTEIMKDYAKVASMETFTAQKGDAKHLNDLARLHGARLVTASETEEGRRWAESRIKSLTGGDPVTANFMRQNQFTYTPQFKLMLVGNHRPRIGTVDDAIRRRLRIVPFTHKPERVDRELPAKLRAEYQGILRWMIEGAVMWFSSSDIETPKAVGDATDGYFDAEDALARWLEECVEIVPRGREETASLFASWKEWAERAGEWQGKQRGLTDRLNGRGFVSVRGAKGKRMIEGLQLKLTSPGMEELPDGVR